MTPMHCQTLKHKYMIMQRIFVQYTFIDLFLYIICIKAFWWVHNKAKGTTIESQFKLFHHFEK